jgi:NAD(P) transhydrogenase subunit alpha
MTAADLAQQAADLAARANELADAASHFTAAAGPVAEAVEPFIFLLATFLMACFVGYYVVWNVTPALHSPLMGVTNAISSVIIVGALLAAAAHGASGEAAAGSVWISKGAGAIAAAFAAVNIFGGFLVTQRMLAMYKKKEKK